MNPTLPSGMQEEADKIKGDAIGNTMYSERWVLKTLIKLSEKYMDYTSSDDYRLESDLEGDLGLLWDMTIEPDVAKYLMDHNALDIIMDVLKFSGSPRLIEIMVGILGNVACEEEVRRLIGSNAELIKIIINLLTFTDSPTLLQLVRLLTTCIWNVAKETKVTVEEGGDNVAEIDSLEEGDCLWTRCLREESELVCRSINFILASSRNAELLTATLGLLESLFNLTWYSGDHFCKQFSTVECIQALMEALKEVTSHAGDESDSQANLRRVEAACAHWITVVHRMTYHHQGRNALREHAEAVCDLVGRLWPQPSEGSTVHTTLATELLEALSQQGEPEDGGGGCSPAG
ncbi:protein saal1 [Ischnura elegans]|uniref:protein saal1 n=1 Tax=Ischnura elegans TaxID=197161 RepID=UPI001ED8AAFA|nr:protein saal1 [Ischnura elegans]